MPSHRQTVEENFNKFPGKKAIYRMGGPTSKNVAQMKYFGILCTNIFYTKLMFYLM